MGMLTQNAPALDPVPSRGPGANAPVALHPVDDFDRDVWCVLGLPFDRVDTAGAASAIAQAARDGRSLFLVTPNTNWLARAARDQAARAHTIEADLSLADGAPIVALARLLGAPLPERVAGSDVFDALCARGSTIGRRLRVFFFGGRPGAAHAAAAALAAAPSGVEAAGALDPGHGDIASMSGEETIAAINAAAPDFLVVSLGAAKGNAWIARNRARLSAPVVSHLGAVVDFTAGTIKRAPPAWRRLGLEWAWRIREEPALWRRYAGDAVFLAGLLFVRLLPELASARTPRQPGPANIMIERSAAAHTVRLSGDLVAPNLAELRTAFRDAAAQDRPLTLDFSAVRRIDRAFLGLLLMLEKHALRKARPVRMIGLRPAHQALLRRNGFDLAHRAPFGVKGAASAIEAPAA